MPAHITLLFPFRHAYVLDEAHSDLADIMVAVSPAANWVWLLALDGGVLGHCHLVTLRSASQVLGAI